MKLDYKLNTMFIFWQLSRKQFDDIFTHYDPVSLERSFSDKI